jgi:hypothetical protein
VSRTLSAINYRHRSGPTKIDFNGTGLLPTTHGEATVESKKGRIEIDAKFEHLVAPQRFGREYLDYVLWAISPEVHALNLGELVPDRSDKGNACHHGYAGLWIDSDCRAVFLRQPAQGCRRS